MSATFTTIRDAEDAIRRRFQADGLCGTLKYPPDKVIETERWWYIPFCWIGCFGFIVSKDDLYVNWLGSASTVTLELCFWGHDHGLFYDLVDFTFAAETERSLAARLVSQFRHMHPNAAKVQPREPVPYRDAEIPEVLSSHFPTFRRHFVWFAIAELHRAYEEGLRFTCGLSKGVSNRCRQPPPPIQF